MTTEQFYALSESEQELQLAAWRIKQGQCAECGHQREECANPDHAWYPQRTRCMASMAKAAAERRYDALHESLPFHDGTETHWAKKYSQATPYHYRDGVTIWVSRDDLTPGDDFLADAPEHESGD